jgi:hypothetical protein
VTGAVVSIQLLRAHGQPPSVEKDGSALATRPTCWAPPPSPLICLLSARIGRFRQVSRLDAPRGVASEPVGRTLHFHRMPEGLVEGGGDEGPRARDESPVGMEVLT